MDQQITIMKQHLFLEQFYIAVILALLILTGCNDNHEENYEDNDGSSFEIELEEVSYARDTIIYRATLELLCDIDTLSEGEVKRTPVQGTVIDEAYPTRYYLAAETLEEARDYFTYFLVPIIAQDSIIEHIDGELELHTIGGDLIFHPQESSDGLARVDVNLKDLPEITEFVFIRESEWPFNDITSCPFTKGEFYLFNGNVYFCFREYQSSKDYGALVSFDSGWREDNFGGAGKSEFYNYKPFSVHTGCMEQNNWIELGQYIDDNPNSIREKVENVRDHGYSNNKTVNAISNIVERKGEYTIGNVHYSSHHTFFAIGKKLRRKYKWYEIDIYYYDAKESNSKKRCKSVHYGRIWIPGFFMAQTPVNKTPDCVVTFTSDQVKPDEDYVYIIKDKKKYGYLIIDK